MKLNCPNCKSYSFVKDGHYFRKNDSRLVQRFRCRVCSKKFATSTFELECGQKKRRVNFLLFKLLASGVSMRRCALILGVHRVTVERKLRYLAKKSQRIQAKVLQPYSDHPIPKVQFDDLITIEHTKLKPLTVSAAIDSKKRIILGAQVAQIPAFGPLAKLSRRKYGRRKNQHRQALTRLFQQLSRLVDQQAVFESDEHKLYPEFVKKYFPNATHARYKGGRGCVTGQGELKKKHFDPLFQLNHTYAMLRANINRLFRRSWCTTKKPERLQDHLDIYIAFHNTMLIRTNVSPPW